MKRYSSFSVVKQVAKEKMGKAESQIETPEALATKDQLSTLKNGCKSIHSSFKSYTNEALPLSVSQGEVVAESLLSLSGALEGSALTHNLKHVGKAQREMDNKLLLLCNLTKEKMVVPTQLVIESDIKKCTDLKNEHETARLKYDAAMTDLKSFQKKGDPTKVLKAEENTQNCKVAYDQSTAALTEVTEHLHSRVRSEMTVQLKEYAQLQLEFFKQGLEIWQQVIENIETQ